DLEAIDQAMTDAASAAERPTLIILRTIIGYPAPTKQNSSKAHGEPLGKDEVRKTKEILGWPLDEPFHVPPEVAAETPRLRARAGSTGTVLKEVPLMGAERVGRNFAWGIREHAMGSVTSGMALHGGVRPFGATFLVFSDYMKPAIRLAALMGLPTIYVFTHDSIGLGEDGPTHQPIEHLAMLRAIPNLSVIRPGDAAETA